MRWKAAGEVREQEREYEREMRKWTQVEETGSGGDKTSDSTLKHALSALPLLKPNYLNHSKTRFKCEALGAIPSPLANVGGERGSTRGDAQRGDDVP